MAGKKDEILNVAHRLFVKQGFHATGLSEILQDSNAPKGSLYYYFPEGKEQLGVEVVKHASIDSTPEINRALFKHNDPAAAIHHYCLSLADEIDGGKPLAGGIFALLDLETSQLNPELNQACRDVYQDTVIPFKHKLFEEGFKPQQADLVANFVVSTIQGAVALARTHQSGEPLRRAGEEIANYIHHLPRK